MGSTWAFSGWHISNLVPSSLKSDGIHSLLRTVFVEMYQRLSDEMKQDLLAKFPKEMEYAELIVQENEWKAKIKTIQPTHLFVRPKEVS